MKYWNKRYGRWIRVQAYKHDGSLHRQWSPAYLVEENDDFWVVVSRASLVTEAEGRRWITREKAVFFLFKKRWMNVIAMFKEKRGICYYVNIASPTIYDDGFLKYIDYDLDVKLYPDGVERTLDEKEFIRHSLEYGYSPELIQIIRNEAMKVRAMMENRKFPFQDETVIGYYDSFVEQNAPKQRTPRREGDS